MPGFTGQRILNEESTVWLKEQHHPQSTSLSYLTTLLIDWQFFAWNTPNVHSGFIDKNMFQILKDSKIGAMFRTLLCLYLLARGFSIRIPLFG
jgi:hypothetical protein